MTALPDGFFEIAAAEASYRDGGGERGLGFRWRSRSRLGAAWLVLVGLVVSAFGAGLGAAPQLGLPVQVSIGALWAVALGVGMSGALLLYAGVASTLNTTTVRIGRAAITRSHGPLPWRGSFVLARTTGDHIEVRRRGEGYRHSFAVVLVREAEPERPLFDAVWRQEDAERVASALRDALAA
ncbi:MAG: hypothetical protein U0234_24745 [Sandaracinus sp.]